MQRIQDEVGKIPGAHIWITEPKEIENYLPGSLLGDAFGVPSPPDPDKYTRFFPSSDPADTGTSFLEQHLKRKTIDKMELALSMTAAARMTKAALQNRFDLATQINTIIEKIGVWNS